MLISISRNLLYAAFLLLPLTFIKVLSNLSLSDIIIVLAFLTLSISHLGKKFLAETVILKNVFIIPMVIFTIGFLISLNRTVYALEGVTAYLQIFFIFIIAYPVLVEVIKDDKQIKILASLLIIPGIVISVLMLLLKFIGIDLGFDLLANEGWRGRLSYGGMEPNVPGRIILQNIPFLAVFILAAKKLSTRLFLVTLILVQLLAIFLTSSRSNMLAFVLGLLLFVFFISRSGRKLNIRNTAIGLIISALFLFALYALNSEFIERPLQRYSTILNPQKSPSSMERIRVINMGLDYLDQNPLIGVGLGNSYIYTKVNVHNPILLTWVENGVLGTVGFTSLYLVLLFNAFLAYKYRFLNNELLLGLAVVMMLMVFGDMFMANSYKRVLWLPALLFIVHFKNLKSTIKVMS